MTSHLIMTSACVDCVGVGDDGRLAEACLHYKV